MVGRAAGSAQAATWPQVNNTSVDFESLNRTASVSIQNQACVCGTHAMIAMAMVDSVIDMFILSKVAHSSTVCSKTQAGEGG